MEESSAPAGGVGGDEQLVLMVDGSTAVPGAMAVAAGSLEADAGVDAATPESTADKPVVPKEQMSLP